MSKAIEKPDETLSTVQPFEFSKEFTKQLNDLDLLKTVQPVSYTHLTLPTICSV